MSSTVFSELMARRDAILERWRAHIRDSYCQTTSKKLQEVSDRFANPVGSYIRGDTERFIDLFCSEEMPDSQRIGDAVDNLVRVRAVQEFAPSAALEFVFALKGIVREELTRPGSRGIGPDEFQVLDGRIDQMSLAVFDRYMSCREQRMEVRIHALQRQSIAYWREHGPGVKRQVSRVVNRRGEVK